MTAKLLSITAPARMPADFPGILRAVADEVERGLVTSFVCAAVRDGEYEFLFPSSRADSLLLATLLQARCVERMHE